MTILEHRLGRCLSAREVAEYLCCDISTVYRHSRELGGVRVGICYKFFERRLIDALSAQASQQPAASIRPAEPVAPVRRSRSSRRDPHDLLA